MAGSNTVQCNAKTSQGIRASNGQNGVYGTLGIAALTNVAGSRYSAASWTSKNGDFWLFGGEGFDAIGSFWPLNDLWNYQPKHSSTVTLSSNANPVFAQSTIALSASVTSSGTVPTGNVTLFEGTTSLDTATLTSLPPTPRSPKCWWTSVSLPHRSTPQPSTMAATSDANRISRNK